MGVTGALVGDRASAQVYGQLISPLGLLRCRRAFQDGKANVDSVAVKDARKALGHNTGDASPSKCQRRVLSRRATAKVVASDDNVSGLDRTRKLGVYVFHTMDRQFPWA